MICAWGLVIPNKLPINRLAIIHKPSEYEFLGLASGDFTGTVKPS